MSTVAALALAALFLTALPSARADSFYWTKAVLKTGAIKSGYTIAVSALQAESAGNVQRRPDEVVGTIGRTYVAVTCVGTAPRITAVIAAVGPDAAEAQRVRDAVNRRIVGIVIID